MTSAAAATATPQITFPIEDTAGSATITLDRIPGGYSLVVTALGQDTSQWCGGFTSLKTAYHEVGRIRASFAEHRTADRIETHANSLRRELDLLEKRPHGMRDNARIGALDTELAALEALSTQRARAQLASQFATAD